MRGLTKEEAEGYENSNLFKSTGIFLYNLKEDDKVSNLIKELTKEYAEYNNKKKEYDKKRKNIGKTLKQKMEEEGLDKYEDDKYKTYVIKQERKKINEDKLLHILEENNINAITKAPDIDKLEELIEEGEISNDLLQEISDCIDINSYSYVQVRDN